MGIEELLEREKKIEKETEREKQRLKRLEEENAKAAMLKDSTLTALAIKKRQKDKAAKKKNIKSEYSRHDDATDDILDATALEEIDDDVIRKIEQSKLNREKEKEKALKDRLSLLEKHQQSDASSDNKKSSKK